MKTGRLRLRRIWLKPGRVPLTMENCRLIARLLGAVDIKIKRHFREPESWSVEAG